jgi:hypothetical protein
MTEPDRPVNHRALAHAVRITATRALLDAVAARADLTRMSADPDTAASGEVLHAMATFAANELGVIAEDLLDQV